MVCLYGEEGALQEVGEMLGCEVHSPAKYSPFEFGRGQASAEEAEGSHPDGCRLLIKNCSDCSV